MACGALECPDGGSGIAGIRLDPALADAGAHRGRIRRIGTRDRGTRRIKVARRALPVRQFAFELRDQLAHRLAGGGLEAAGVLDGFFPVALGLVDADQVAQRLRARAGRSWPDRRTRSRRDQAGLNACSPRPAPASACTFCGSLRSGRCTKRLVQPDRAIDLATAAEQVSQRDLGLEGFLVQLGDMQEQLDGLVRLLVEQVVQAAEIGGGQLADLVIAMALAAAPTDHPTCQRSQRHEDQEPEPLVEEIHAQASLRGERTAFSARRRRRRKGRDHGDRQDPATEQHAQQQGYQHGQPQAGADRGHSQVESRQVAY